MSRLVDRDGFLRPPPAGYTPIRARPTPPAPRVQRPEATPLDLRGRSLRQALVGAGYRPRDWPGLVLWYVDGAAPAVVEKAPLFAWLRSMGEDDLVAQLEAPPRAEWIATLKLPKSLATSIAVAGTLHAVAPKRRAR